MSKTLVLFAYSKYKSGLINFIKKAIFQDSNIDFIIISNGIDLDTDVKGMLPDYVHFLKRENTGYDFGAWSGGLFHNNNYLNYSHYVFINDTTSGPFYKGEPGSNWVNEFLKGLQGNVRLFGSTINTCGDPYLKSHVQSNVFCIDKEVVKYLISKEIFSLTNLVTSHFDLIYNKEVRMSRKIIENNWNIGSRMKYFQGVDFTFCGKKPSDYSCDLLLQDLMYPQFENVYWTKEEIMFIKGNRF
jgi:hypothetical protein